MQWLPHIFFTKISDRIIIIQSLLKSTNFQSYTCKETVQKMGPAGCGACFDNLQPTVPGNAGSRVVPELSPLDWESIHRVCFDSSQSRYIISLEPPFSLEVYQGTPVTCSPVRALLVQHVFDSWTGMPGGRSPKGALSAGRSGSWIPGCCTEG